jgi:hypothetical protein
MSSGVGAIRAPCAEKSASLMADPSPAPGLDQHVVAALGELADTDRRDCDAARARPVDVWSGAKLANGDAQQILRPLELERSRKPASGEAVDQPDQYVRCVLGDDIGRE